MRNVNEHPASALRPLIRAVLVLVLLALSATGARAGAGTEFVVSRTDDPAPDDCLPEDCSLREAVIAANETAGPDTITLGPGAYNLALTGENEDNARTGDLDIKDDLTITGAGSAATTVDGASVDRVFQVDEDVTASITALTVQGGNTDQPGGGVRNDGSLSVSDVRIANNIGGAGGGIYSEGALTLENVTFGVNRASGNGGALAVVGGEATLNEVALVDNSVLREELSGGGIYLDGTLTFTMGAITQNAAAVGAGIFTEDGSTLTVENVNVGQNISTTSGGGITNNGELTITNSVIANNSAADAHGGGITNTGNAALTNVTLAGNTAGELGGGVRNEADMSLTHVTIAGNTGGDGGGGISDADSLTLKNSIVADNRGGDCHADESIDTEGRNLDGDNSCGLSEEDGDLPDTDPLLGDLGPNGGPTATRPLLAESPAIDAAEDCPPPDTDQRGFERPLDGDGDGDAECDLGAFEFDPAQAAPPQDEGTPAGSPAPDGSGEPAPSSDEDDDDGFPWWIVVVAVAGGVVVLGGGGYALYRWRTQRGETSPGDGPPPDAPAGPMTH